MGALCINKRSSRQMRSMIRLKTCRSSSLRSIHTRTGIHMRTRTWDYTACATSPCNRVYVLNGKIDECRGTRAPRYLARAGARARGVDSVGCCLVQSLREIDKEPTTVGAQLGHRLRMLACRVCVLYESSFSLSLSLSLAKAAMPPRALKRARPGLHPLANSQAPH